MGLSILKFTGTGTGISLRSIFRSLNSYSGARMVSYYTSHELSNYFSSSYNSLSSYFSSSYDSLFSSSSPLLMLSPTNSNRFYDFYSFDKNRLFTIPKPEKTPNSTKIIGSSHGWLACFNHRRKELYLSNPLSGRRVNLPPIQKLSLSKSSLRHGIRKIIISGYDPDSKECRVMMLFNFTDALAFCCPGISSSTEWTTINRSNNGYFVDFVYCDTQELLFTLNGDIPLELQAWDLRNPLTPSLVWSCKDSKLEDCSDSGGYSNPVECDLFCSNHKAQHYLVVSQQGELFLVYRYVCKFMLPDGECAPAGLDDDDDGELFSRFPPKTVNYDVFKIVREGDGGKKVFMDGHLDDQVMFVGWPSHGMAMPAAEANGFQPNTICFTDDTFTYSKEVRGTDNGIFDYKNKTFHPCYYPFDYQSLKKKILPPPLWFVEE